MDEDTSRFEVLEYLPEAIAVFKRTPDGQYVKLYSNKNVSKLFGFDVDLIYSHDDILNAIYSEDRERVLSEFRASTRAGKGTDTTYRIITRGGIHWIHHYSHAAAQEDGSCLFYATFDDVTSQKEAEEAQKATLSKRFNAYFDNRFDVNDKNSMMAVMDLQSSILKSIASMYVVMYLADLQTDTFIEIWCMDHVKKLFGNVHSTKGVLNLVVENFVAPDFREAARAFNDTDTLAERLKGKPLISMDYDATVAGWCREQFIPVSWDEDGLTKEVLCIEQRIQAEKMKVDNLKRRAETDGMTGLINRTSGADYIDKSLAEDQHGMFCLFDVDDFKHFNDCYGHDAGDAVLCGISDCMRKTFRDTDILIRLGGDEFGIFIPEKISPEAGGIKLKQLCQRIENLTFDKFSETVHITYGLAFADGTNYLNFDQIFKAADTLMYTFKKEKKLRRAE